MSNQELTYEDYNKKSYSVHGNKEKYSKQIKAIGGRWNPRMKNGEGWLVPKDSFEELKALVNSVNNSSKKSDSAKSRKSQSKYHREVSESEDSEEDVEELDSDEDDSEEEKEDDSEEEKEDDSEEDDDEVRMNDLTDSEDSEKETKVHPLKNKTKLDLLKE